MPNLSQININITDPIPPENFATIDKNSLVGTVYTKAQDNEWRAEVEATVQTGIKGVLKPNTPYDAVTNPYPTPWVAGNPDKYEKFDIDQAGTFPNTKKTNGDAVEVTDQELALNEVQIWVKNGIAEKVLKAMPQATQSIVPFSTSTFPLVAPTPPAAPIQRTHENSIWQLKDGETATIADVPGVSDKWKVIEDLTAVKKNTFNRNIEESTIPFVIVDEENNSAFAVKSNGETDFKASKLSQALMGFGNEKVFEIVDNNDNLALRVNSDGTLDAKLSDFTLQQVLNSSTLTIREYLPKINNLKYCQIGDSITAFDDKNGSGGYIGFGYGRVVVNALNVSYGNHYPLGHNGQTTTSYVMSQLPNVPQDCDIYTVCLGTNDFMIADDPLGTMDDYINNTGYTTSYGAYRMLMDRILTGRENNTPLIVLITPMHKGKFSIFNGDNVPNHYGKNLVDYVNMVKEIAIYEGVGLLDLFNDGVVLRRFLNQNDTSNNNDVLYDNLHPSIKGLKLIGTRLLSKILERLPDSYGYQMFS